MTHDPAAPAPGASPAAPAPASHAIDGRTAFQDAVREALEQAAQAGCRELIFVDRDFADWPLGEGAVIDALRRWAYPHRKLTMLAEHFDDVPRRHPRFVQWRVDYAHLVDCRAAHEDDARELPTLLAAPGLFVLRLFDPQRYRGRLDQEAAEWLRMRDRVDAIAQRSTESFPASTLGL